MSFAGSNFCYLAQVAISATSGSSFCYLSQVAISATWPGMRMRRIQCIAFVCISKILMGKSSYRQILL